MSEYGFPVQLIRFERGMPESVAMAVPIGGTGSRRVERFIERGGG